jgi:hypothetical protein
MTSVSAKNVTVGFDRVGPSQNFLGSCRRSD